MWANCAVALRVEHSLIATLPTKIVAIAPLIRRAAQTRGDHVFNMKVDLSVDQVLFIASAYLLRLEMSSLL